MRLDGPKSGEPIDDEEDDRFIAYLGRTLNEQRGRVPQDIGWDQLQQRIRQQSREAEGPVTDSGTRPSKVHAASLSSTLRDWWQGIAGLPRGLVFAGAAAGVLLVVQSGVLGMLLLDRQDTPTSEYRGPAGAAPGAARAGSVRVMLRQDISMKDWSRALLDSGATVVDGPNSLGEYWLVPDRGSPEEIAQLLKSQGLIINWVIDPADGR